MIKRYLKTVIKKVANIFFKLIIQQITKDKPLMPHNTPDDTYEIFENIDENKYFDKKIILPYTDMDLLNRINIYKPYEILQTDFIKSNSEKIFEIIQNSKDLVLPIALLNKAGENSGDTDNIMLEFDNKIKSLELKYKNRFHYLPIKSKNRISQIKVKSQNYDIAIGKPIVKDKKLLENKPKLIVHIFVDALTQSMIEKFGYEIMPNTKKYFEKNGTFFTNAYAQAEWTLSSVAGIFTGKYTHEHLLYHPRRENKIEHTTLADTLQKEGYLTYACTNIPKLTPINGYDKGFDRYVLAIDKDYNYIINEASEQLDAFGGNQYLFLGFFDTHESHRLQPISSQVSNELKDFQFKPLKGNSKDTSVLYDEERINMFKNSITHFDKKLQRLYDEIDMYDKDALVVLHSDHGVNFMTNTTELLGKEREKVIFLYKNNKEPQNNNSIKEIRELPSMICNELNIDNVFEYHHNGYAITESLYPNKEYEVAIRNEKYVLFFKVAWEDVKKRNIKNYKHNYSIHPLDNEVQIIKKCEQLDGFINVAENCYLNLIKNIRKYSEV